MANKLELKVLLDAVDRITSPLKSINRESRATQVAINELRKQLRGLSGEQDKAAADASALNASLAAQQAHLKKVGEQARRLRAAQAELQNAKQFAGNMATTGVAAGAAGMALAVPVAKTVKDFATMETAMLGVAKQVEGARDDAGNLTSVYYNMRQEIFKLARTTPMATTEIAALVEGAARMGIQGQDNLMAFTRMAANAATAFELPADQIADNMGKIAGLYKIPMQSIADLGDAINWLDDNAQSKGADIIEVMQRLGGVADKLDYRQAAALGSTFLSLGAGAEVAASASNAMVRELSVATMQSQRFQAGMQALGLSSENIEKAMATDAMGTIQSVLEKIKTLNIEDQMRVTTQLFGKEYGDDAAKLANNLDELKRQLDLVNAAQAQGSMAREAGARNDTAEAQFLMAKNRLLEISARLGETLQPILTNLFMHFGNIADAVNEWVQANPELAGGIMKAVAVISALLIGIGGLMVAFSAIIVPIATLKFGLATLGIQGFSLGKAFSLLRPIINMLGSGLLTAGKLLGQALVGGLGLLGKSMAALGSIMVRVTVLFVSNPILLVVAAIAAAAYLIYRNWDKLVPFFQRLWGKLVATWVNLRENIRSIASSFSEIGRDMIQGLIRGITARLSALKSTIVNAASSAAAWFREKLDIRSPSRVFQQYGAYTMQGLALGIQGAAGEPIRAMSAMARNIMTVPMDTRPPIGRTGGTGTMLGRMATAAGGAVTAGGGIVIHVHAAPGMNELDLARAVGREFDRRTSAAAVRQRSRYQDID